MSERGFSLMELVCAMAVVTITVTAVMVGEREQLTGVRRSYDELAATRAAASHLEEITAGAGVLWTGVYPFLTPLEGCAGERRVRRIETGLYEVTVTVRRGEEQLARLVTLVPTAEREQEER